MNDETRIEVLRQALRVTIEEATEGLGIASSDPMVAVMQEALDVTAEQGGAA